MEHVFQECDFSILLTLLICNLVLHFIMYSIIEFCVMFQQYSSGYFYVYRVYICAAFGVINGYYQCPLNSNFSLGDLYPAPDPCHCAEQTFFKLLTSKSKCSVSPVLLRTGRSADADKPARRVYTGYGFLLAFYRNFIRNMHRF